MDALTSKHPTGHNGERRTHQQADQSDQGAVYDDVGHLLSPGYRLGGRVLVEKLASVALVVSLQASCAGLQVVVDANCFRVAGAAVFDAAGAEYNSVLLAHPLQLSYERAHSSPASTQAPMISYSSSVE